MESWWRKWHNGQCSKGCELIHPQHLTVSLLYECVVFLGNNFFKIVLENGVHIVSIRWLNWPKLLGQKLKEKQWDSLIIKEFWLVLWGLMGVSVNPLNRITIPLLCQLSYAGPQLYIFYFTIFFSYCIFLFPQIILYFLRPHSFKSSKFTQQAFSLSIKA